MEMVDNHMKDDSKKDSIVNLIATCTAVLRGHPYGISCLAITPDGKLLASSCGSGEDMTVRLWSLPDGKPLHPLQGHEAMVRHIAISPDSRLLASAADTQFDKTIRLWSLPDGILRRKIDCPADCLAISPDGLLLVSATSGGAVKLWSLPDGKPLQTLQHESYVACLAITKDGRLLVTAGFDNIRLWSLPDGKPLRTLQEGVSSVHPLAISPDGRMLASGARNSMIRLWSLPNGQTLNSLEGAGCPWDITDFAFTSDSMLLASASWDVDNAVRIWSLPDSTPLLTLQGHAKGVNCLSISPDGRILASGSLDKKIHLWSLPEGKLLQSLEGHTESVGHLAFSQDGGLLVSGSDDHTIRLWKLCAKDLLENQPVGVGAQGPVEIDDESVEIDDESVEIDDERMTFSSIFSAAEEGNLAEVKRHLEAGESPNATSGQWNKTPLLAAADSGRLEVVKLLVEMGANVNMADEIGAVPITVAANCGHVEIVRYLVEKGALYHSPEIGLHPIVNAAHNGQLAVVKYLVEEKEVPVKGHTMHGDPPLHCAAANGHIEVVQYLIDHGADPYEAGTYRKTAFETVEGCMKLNNVTEADREKYRRILKVLRHENEISRTAIKQQSKRTWEFWK
jgi:WD40 repeat protein